MEIVRIFAENLSLCAICYNEGESDEFRRLMNLWQDTEYLTEFFDSNSSFLNTEKYWKGVTVTDAVFKTMDCAADFEERIELAFNEERLDDIFDDLDNKQYNLPHLYKQKSKEKWLRLYALKMESNSYLITGGAIKLTETMQGAEDTNKELQKFETVRNYLISLGVIDKEGFEDLVVIDF